jgi:small subunit ribosomal protein S1
MESNMPAASSNEPLPEATTVAASHAEAPNGMASHPADAQSGAFTPATQEAPIEALPDVAQPEAESTQPVAESALPEAESTQPVVESALPEAAAEAAIPVTPPVDDLGYEPQLDDEMPADESMAALLDEHTGEPRLRKGDIIEGTIVQTTPTEILMDIGLKSEGVVSGKELERMDRETLEKLKEGEKVLAYVLIPENKSGHVVLSLVRALEEQDWRVAEEMRQSGQIYTGKVDGYNKGGLIVRFGRVRGFVPESQASRERRARASGTDPQEKWGGMRGEDIAVKVVEVDRARNRLILSERDAAPHMREQSKERLLGELNVGDIKVGRVKSLADFGAFVDVGGADGLVHLTELSWKHVTHPREILKVGQEVEVEVISVDRDRKRIGLSIKRREEDPWMVVAREYQIGQLVQGTITKLTKFGAFARLVDNPEIEGLIHISELASQRVNHPRDVVNEGDVLTLRVVKIDAEQRRLGLSLKRVVSNEYVEADYRRAVERPEPTPAVSDLADYEAASLKEDERKRSERKKGKRGKKGKGEGGEFEEFEDGAGDDDDDF